MLNISVINVYTNVEYIYYQCLIIQMLNISIINVYANVKYICYRCLYKF